MKYNKTHEWVKMDGTVAVVGITNYAQNQLSDVVYIDFPSVGDSFNKNEQLLAIESVKAASDVYAPVSGKVIEINNALEDAPETVNNSPEDKGWLVKLELSNSSELNDLMDLSDYEKITVE